MEFRERERSGAVISKARAEENSQAGDRETTGEEIREGGGIEIKNPGRRIPSSTSPRSPRRIRFSLKTTTSRKRSRGKRRVVVGDGRGIGVYSRRDDK